MKKCGDDIMSENLHLYTAMESKVYEFIGKFNNETYKYFDTVWDIYCDLITKEIISEVEIWNWLIRYNILKLSTKELELYKTYIDEACKDMCHSVDEDKADEMFEKLDNTTFNLSDEDMIDVISDCMRNSCEWHEIDKNGHNMKHLEEWEDILNDSKQFFDMHNPCPRCALDTELSFTDSQEQLYDLKIDLKGLDEKQMDDICRFIADEL